MTRYGYTPTHPGEVIKDELEYRHISQRELAAETGIPYKHLNDILNERRPLTAPVAMLIEAAVDIPSDMLMHLQMKYNIHVARNDSSLLQRLKKIRKIAVVL